MATESRRPASVPVGGMAHGEDPAADPTTGPAPAPPGASGWRGAWQSLWSPTLLGVVISCVLMPFTSWALDNSVWWWATADGAQRLGLYQRLHFAYPPLWGEMLQAMGWLYQLIGIPAGSLATGSHAFQSVEQSGKFGSIITSPLFNVSFKLALLAAALGTGLLVWSLTRRLTKDPGRARLAFVLWFLNPFVIFEAAVFGAFDLLVAFAVLGALCCFISRRYLVAGATLALAIAIKGTPVLLLPLLVTILVDRERADPGAWRRALGSLAAGVVGVLAVIVVPFLATGQFGAMKLAVFGRVGGVQSGALSIFGITRFRGLGWITQELYGVHELGRIVLVLAIVGSVALGLVGGWLARRDLVLGVVGGSALVLALVLVLGPQTNPQYVLWPLPELVVLVAAWRRGWLALVLCSVVPLLSVITIYGPFAILLPLSRFTHLLSAQTLARAVQTWSAAGPTPWSSSGGGAGRYDGPLAVLLIVGIAALAVTVVRSSGHGSRVGGRSRVGGQWRAGGRGSGIDGRRVTLPSASNAVAVVVVLVLVVVTAGQIAVGASGNRSTVSLSGHLTTTTAAPTAGATATATVQVRVAPAPALEGLRLVAFPTLRTGPPRRVFYYDDPAYPQTNPAVISGNWSQLSSTFSLRQSSDQLARVNTAQLVAVLRDVARAPDTALIDLTGTLPAAAFAPFRNLVRPWLDAGGTLYWGGSPIGLLYGTARHGGQPAQVRSIGLGGVAQFFDPRRLATPSAQTASAVGTVPSATARALGMDYLLNGKGLRVKPPGPRFRALGSVGDGRSSVTSVQEGSGHIVVLGGSLVNNQLVGATLSILALSDVVDATAAPVWRTVPTSVVDHGGTVHWTAHLAAPSPHAVIIAFDPTRQGVVLRQLWLTAGRR